MSVLSMLAEPNVESGANIEVSPGSSPERLGPPLRFRVGCRISVESVKADEM